MVFSFQPGDALYPKDENGKIIYHETDLCATWEVSKHNFHICFKKIKNKKNPNFQSCL